MKQEKIQKRKKKLKILIDSLKWYLLVFTLIEAFYLVGKLLKHEGKQPKIAS